MPEKNKLVSRITALLTCFLLCVSAYVPVSAAGSETLTDNTGYRAYLEYYCDGTTTAGITRKTFVNVYLKAGETLYLASSVHNSTLDVNDIKQDAPTGCDILLIKPSGDTLSFDVIENGIGYIGTAAQEKAGINIDGSNTKGYVPLSYAAEHDGVYQIRYHSPTGVNSSNPAPVLTTDEWKQSPATVGAWNATVLGTDSKIKTGRTYTKCLALNMGNNMSNGKYMRLESSVYVVTTDGYIYKTDFDGMNPYGFIFFANNRGLVSVDSNYSLYHSYVSNNNQLSDLHKQGATYQNPWNPDTDLDRTFNIFFEKPDPELEGILYPTAYQPEPAKNFSFVGTTGKNETHIDSGGYFKFDITNATSAIITLDLTNVPLGDGTAENYGIVKLGNPVVPGTNYFYWDGRGADGRVIPEGEYSDQKIKVSIETYSGEYHFPLFDVEMAPNGISVTRVNRIYKESTDSNGNIYNEDVTQSCDNLKSYIYYNNSVRKSGYKNKADIIADGKDCSAGVDSSLDPVTQKYAMPFTTNSSGNYTGDQTALDIWTYANSNTPLTSYLPAPIIITDHMSASISGRVFYDKIFTSLTAADNFYNLNEGDYMLDHIKVELTYTYPADDGTEKKVVTETTTDAKGQYYFFGIPVLDSGEITACTVRVIRPLESYSVTTENTTTNSNLTTGSLSQQVFLGGINAEGEINYVSNISLSDVGFQYEQIEKSITIKKDWVVNISGDKNRPETVTVNIRSYYLDADNSKVEVHQYPAILTRANQWTVIYSHLPAYFDAAAAVSLQYEIVSETYSLRGDDTSYVVNAGESASQSLPYNTTFYTEKTIGGAVLTVRNAPKTGTLQLTKRDADNTELLLDNVSFSLLEKTNLTAIPEGEENNYKIIDGSVYLYVETAATNQNGVLTFTELDLNDYYFVEVIPKTGYIPDSSLYKVEITAEQMYVTQTVYNKKFEGSLLTVTVKVDQAQTGVNIPVNITYSANSDFSDSVSHDLMAVIQAGITEYSVCDALEIPAGSYVKVTEGDNVYYFDAPGSTLKDAAEAEAPYLGGQVFVAADGHSYTVTLSNLKNEVALFTMNITKVDGKSGSALPGAEFTLYSDADCKTEVAVKTTALDNSARAVASFTGLSAGTYYLKETAAPSGYLLPSDVKVIVIERGGTVTVDTASVTVSENTFTLTVANYLDVVIPQSGTGMTSALFIALGIGLCLTATYLAVKRGRTASVYSTYSNK